MVKRSPLDDIYGALSDPSRRRMLEALRRGPQTVSALGAPLDMTLASVGKHLAVLERAGLVRSAKSGRVRSCVLVAGPLDDAERWIAEQRADWTERLDRLESRLAEPETAP